MGFLRKIAEQPIYTAGISLYRFGVRIAALRSTKARKLNRGQRDIYARISSKISHDDKVIWVHAASLGEFEQGRPLIEKIKEKRPGYKILLTFFSPSGYEVRKNFEGADCVTYLPFDTPRRVRKFLDAVRPEMAIFVKYEIWRNYLYELSRRKIPTYLISAVFRPGQHFFKHKNSWSADWLRQYDHIFVQDESSAALLKKIGIKETSVCGDTRFDRVTDIRRLQKDIPVLKEFRITADGKPVFMAGSSWPADEDIYTDWFNNHKEIKLVIAPHEFDKARLSELSDRFKNGVLMMSEAEPEPSLIGTSRPQVLVIDCFGLLSSAYAYCDAAYIGGGFGAGLHNINEAAVYGVPVIYGPNNKKFIEAREMKQCGGGIEISSRKEFEEIAGRLIDKQERQQRGKKAEEYIQSKLGATDKIFETIFK